jgi:threonine synthase
MTSYLRYLECSRCQAHYNPKEIQTYCTQCQSPLLAVYDLEGVGRNVDPEEISRRPRGMWRWSELLPVYDPQHMLSLGEGDTPLLPLPRLGEALGLQRLFVKEESLNPTASFKARGLAAAVSKAKELGIQKLVIPTAGNAGGALAAYAARGGMEAYVFMPIDTPPANIAECQVTGAQVTLVEGLISDAAKAASTRAREEGWFDVSTFKEPYRTEGKKIMGYELAEAFGWQLPDVIIYPTGGGTGLVGMWKAFAELEALGWLKRAARPRMVAVQSSGCAPVVKALEEGAETCEFWQGAATVASGLRVPKSFADRLILQDIRSSSGTAAAVDDGEILAAQKQFASLEGFFAAPEGAATVAAAARLAHDGWILPHERVVLFNTGSGLKYI